MLVQSVIAAYAARGITSDPVTWDKTPPTLADVYDAYAARPQSQRSDALAQVMESMTLLDLFDTDQEEYPHLFDQIRGTVIMDMSGYPEGLKQFTLSMVLEILCTQMQGREKSISRELRKMILVDNADELLRSGSDILGRLLSQGREYGVGILLAVQNLDGFRDESFDYRKWIRTWVLHNVENLHKSDLEFLLQIDIYDSMLDRMYQASRRLEKLHSLIRIGTEIPELAEDLPFYEIAEDAAQSYLVEEKKDAEPVPLAGMPVLDVGHLDDLVVLEDMPAGLVDLMDDLGT
jgi:DNA phosphorothioation-dependent restriction protein DptH